MSGGPPPPPLPAGNSALLGAIQGGTTLRSTADRPPPVPQPEDPRSSLLSAIKTGASLKSAASRVIDAPPKVEDTRSSMLSQIKLGAQLKKVVVAPVVKEAPKNDSVMAVMARRAAIAAESDSESDADDWD